ncbi:TetR/AcrR family transcriptional regulator [Pseudonocardia sp. C8]|uniref:TetR/AcrR family transcriptional regulator n=1 Tax=Pseudonocardia sp. C8 TaxID=2762759 RepID=UPI00164295AC|nr:TetR/AcrR family transcriptional regulator [Pseudonocardia sp. C8]MBC3192586.1 TetR/AcrR family transcriptional regulator [Pseudonocardia sp. C8]
MPADASTATDRPHRDTPPRREDRRTRRTRTALQHALVELALERGYAHLTVEEIAERADVGRATFYTHYRDKDELLDAVVRTLLDELRDLLATELDDDTGFTGRPVHVLFRHAAQRSAPYRLILRGDGDGRALLALTDALSRSTWSIFTRRIAAHGVTPRVDPELLARAWVGEQLAVLTWWFDRPDPPMSLDDAARMLADLSRHGRWWATGFDGPPPEGGGTPPA